MPTLGSLHTDRPELEITFAWPQNPIAYRGAKVTGLTTFSVTQLPEGPAQRQLQAGALVHITDHVAFRVRGRTATAVAELLHQMASNQCAALVVTGSPGGEQPFPEPIRQLSDELGIPLMVTTAPPERWRGVHEGIQNCRLAYAERQAAQLNTLIHQLPAQLADSKAMQRIADLLARALDAQVLVSEPERVLAASPDTAPEQLAQAIIRQSVESSGHDVPTGPHTQLISLAPATGAETVLAVASRLPFDEADMRLLRHAAKLLGLVDQARREYRPAADASRTVRMAAVELLLDAETDKARRVMAGLAPGLLDPDMARVFAIETTAAQRDAVVRRCETATAGRALVVADPRSNRRVLVIHPVDPGDEANDRVASDLTRIVAGQGAEASLGGSALYSLSLVSDALHEALTAQRFAVHQPDSVALSAQDTDLLSLLPLQDAQRWAHRLLYPLMHDAQWDQLRETLPTALAYPYTVAARRLDLHRNTVTRRVARAAELLCVDLNTVAHRTVVGLALELVTQRELDLSTVAEYSQPPALQSLLAAPRLKAWADALLHTARNDRRDLLSTGASWLNYDAHIEPAARALGLSDVTVRSHLRALERHMSRDLGSLTGVRDLHFSLHLATDFPLTDRGAPSCVAA